jgi:hypothetical protein
MAPSAVPARGGLWSFYCGDTGEFYMVLKIVREIALRIDIINIGGFSFRAHLENIEAVRIALAEKGINLTIECYAERR